MMATSSVLVLGALTVTGVYMRNQMQQSQNDGYTIDFSALEEQADNKFREIENSRKDQAQQKDLPGPGEEWAMQIPDEDLDYFPLEAGSNEITIPGVTEPKKTVDESSSQGMRDGADTVKNQKQEKQLEKAVGQEEKKPAAETAAKDVQPFTGLTEESPVISEELHFTASAMTRPVEGEVLLPYSMDHSVYFATLDQYKYNPAVIYQTGQGDTVKACAAGRVINIHSDAKLGHMLVLDLGDGYQAIYGQLENIEVPIGAMVEAGENLAQIAAPTKYYSAEGANLYFQVKQNDQTLDPEEFFE